MSWCSKKGSFRRFFPFSLVANLTRNVSLVLHLRVFSNDSMTSPTVADRDSASSPSFPRVVLGAPTLIDGQATLALTFLHCWSKWPRHCQKKQILIKKVLAMRAKCVFFDLEFLFVLDWKEQGMFLNLPCNIETLQFSVLRFGWWLSSWIVGISGATLYARCTGCKNFAIVSHWFGILDDEPTNLPWAC